MTKKVKIATSAFLSVAVAFVSLGVLWGSASAATTYTSAQISAHNTASDCWLIISGKVYDVTNFIPIHPGGNAIVAYCGQDATAVFDPIHNQTAFNLLPTYYIGDLATTTPVADLTAPSALSGVPSQTTIALSWTASTGGVAPITYSIFRNASAVGTTSGTVFTDTGLMPTTT